MSPTCPLLCNDLSPGCRFSKSTKWRGLRPREPPSGVYKSGPVRCKKGYTYDASMSAALRTMSSYEAMFAWPKIMVAYHNGPLSLLIGMGLFGLFTGVGFLVAATWRHLTLMSRGEWHDPTLRQLHHVMAILFLIKAMSYLCVYGDVYVSFPGLFVWLSILEGLWYANRKLTPDSDEVLHEAENAAASPQRHGISMSGADSYRL